MPLPHKDEFGCQAAGWDTYMVFVNGIFFPTGKAIVRIANNHCRREGIPEHKFQDKPRREDRMRDKEK